MKPARLMILSLTCICLSTGLAASAASGSDARVTYDFRGPYSATVVINYQSGRKLRHEAWPVEFDPSGAQTKSASFIILRRDLGLCWAADGTTCSYTEAPLNPDYREMFFPDLSGFRKEKKADICGYTCQIYQSKKKDDLFIWVLRPENLVLRIEQGPEGHKTIYEARRVEFGPQDNALFDPPTDYRKYTLAELLDLEITPSILADALFQEVESAEINQSGTGARLLDPEAINTLKRYISESTNLGETSQLELRASSLWFAIKSHSGRAFALRYDRESGSLSVHKFEASWQWLYTCWLHEDLARKFMIGDYRLSAPKEMGGWVDGLLTR